MTNKGDIKISYRSINTPNFGQNRPKNVIFGQVIFSAGTNETRYGMRRERGQGGKSAHHSSNYVREKRCHRHPEFPTGHPCKYYPGATLLDFRDQTRTGMFKVLWPMALALAEFRYHMVLYGYLYIWSIMKA